MEPLPTPLERLLALERDLELLKASRVPEAIRKQGQSGLPPRHIWPADELLLTRILRRSPAAIQAYQGHAELIKSEPRGLHLTAAETTSAFQFCEIMDGDAVAWVDRSSLRWAWGSDYFQMLFHSPSDVETPDKLVLQALPLFKPIARGQVWALHRKGEMVLQSRPFPEQAEQAMMLRRLEKLDRRFSQQKVQFEAQLQDLRSQLYLQQSLIERLMRLSPSDPDTAT